MKKILVAVVIALLVISTGSLTAFSIQAANTIKENNTQIASLNETLTALQSDMSNMRTATSTSTASQPLSVADIVTLVNPAVVRIDVTGSGFVAEGSGFIVDQNGYVITNHHVIENADTIQVTLATGDSYAATVADDNADRDLALLKMTSSRTDFPVIKLASASDAQVGDTLLLCGYPLGLTLSGPATFTQGIVSALRTINGLDYIQTDASINPGNSGGPAIGMQGTLVGVCVAALTDSGVAAEGLGLVIPVGDILTFIDRGTVACANCHYTPTPTPTS